MKRKGGNISITRNRGEVGRAVAVAILREIFDVLRESVIITCVTIDSPISRDSGSPDKAFKIRIKCNLDNNSRDRIKPILEKYQTNMNEEKGFVIISSFPSSWNVCEVK